MRIAFATYSDYPDITADDDLAARELHRRGVEVVPAVWTGTRPDALDAVVLRSCWDYHHAPGRFADWVAATEQEGIPLLNAAAVVRWNLHKGYLKELAARGTAIPQTIWVERGAAPDLRELLLAHGIEEAVVKPAVSLSAHNTWRTSVDQARICQHHFEYLTAAGDVMVQAYVNEVASRGEISFVFLGGAYSHAIVKRPRAGDFRVQMDHGGTRAVWNAPADQVTQAQQIVDLVDHPLVYARVDAVDVAGRLVLMELELIDPVLFLAYAPDAPARFADAVLGALS